MQMLLRHFKGTCDQSLSRARCSCGRVKMEQPYYWLMSISFVERCFIFDVKTK